MTLLEVELSFINVYWGTRIGVELAPCCPRSFSFISKEC